MEGVLYAHLPLVRLLVPNNWFCSIALSCLGLLECSVLTWLPAGDVPITCSRGGYCPSHGGGQNTPGHWDCLTVNCGHVLRIWSDILDFTRLYKYLHFYKRGALGEEYFISN